MMKHCRSLNNQHSDSDTIHLTSNYSLKRILGEDLKIS